MRVFELFAVVVVIFQHRGELRGMKAILFVDTDAACAALTKGSAKNTVALMLVFTMWPLAAQYGKAIRARRVP